MGLECWSRLISAFVTRADARDVRFREGNSVQQGPVWSLQTIVSEQLAGRVGETPYSPRLVGQIVDHLASHLFRRTNIAADTVPDIRKFYSDLFGLDAVMDLGWIVTLASRETTFPQISILSEGGSGAPVPDVSIEVDNVDEVYR